MPPLMQADMDHFIRSKAGRSLAFTLYQQSSLTGSSQFQVRQLLQRGLRHPDLDAADAKRGLQAGLPSA